MYLKKDAETWLKMQRNQFSPTFCGSIEFDTFNGNIGIIAIVPKFEC